VPAPPLPPIGQETGIDLGLESFATRADGAPIFTPRCSRKAEAYLRRCQRRVARRKKGSHRRKKGSHRRKKGSHRRKKALTLLAKAHQHVRRQDFHHKEARKLVRENAVLSHEELQTANMVQNHSLAKSISDAGWRAFLRILAAKAVYAGRRVVAVPPAYTSQRCSGGGRIVWKGLSVRWHQCPYEDGGTSLHRDHNAAQNLLRLGQERRRLGVVGSDRSRQASPWSVGTCVA
jgi:putative transposase